MSSMELNSKRSKRPRSRSPPYRPRLPKSPRADNYSRSHQNQADREAREWVDKEDEFVLRQAKKKAQIRVREGRAKPVDWLAVILTVIDPEKDVLDDDADDADIEIMDPVGLAGELNGEELSGLEKDIDHYLALEKRTQNRRFWHAMKLVCLEKKNRLEAPKRGVRGINSVSSEVNELLGRNSPAQLDALESQVRNKLRTDQAIDTEYWEYLLDSVKFYRAKANIKTMYQDILNTRVSRFRSEQLKEAKSTELRLEGNSVESNEIPGYLLYGRRLDPEPALKVEAADRRLQIVQEQDFLVSAETDRKRVQERVYIPKGLNLASQQRMYNNTLQTQASGGDALPSVSAVYDKEAAHSLEEDEEAFTMEEDVQTNTKQKWEGSYRARKPKYVNRVQMGYEWNKYNQTHYDQDNPPPKVVQGYRFNVFYPDLIDKFKAPTYRIERENGRKKGQSFAPAGEEDTCIIRFMSGPPYEDIAFRIVDKEWDYSAKRERGFRSSFDKDVLQLHFQFKKVYYRK